MHPLVLRFVLVFGSLIILGIGVYFYIKIRPSSKKCCNNII